MTATFPPLKVYAVTQKEAPTQQAAGQVTVSPDLPPQPLWGYAIGTPATPTPFASSAVTPRVTLSPTVAELGLVGRGTSDATTPVDCIAVATKVVWTALKVGRLVFRTMVVSEGSQGSFQFIRPPVDSFPRFGIFDFARKLSDYLKSPAGVLQS